MRNHCKNILAYAAVFLHLVFSLPFPVLAASEKSSEKVLIQSIDAQNKDFKSFLKKTQAYKSLEQIGTRVDPESKDQLQSLKKLADAEFTGSEPEKSFVMYESLVGMALEEDWKKEQRQSIFTAFFRMAQVKPKESAKWIHKAIEFDPTQSPNAELIPRQLQKDFKKIKANMAKQKIALDLHDGAKYYVNGIKSLKSIYKKSMYRITFISNIYGKSTNLVSSDEVLELLPFGPPVAQGKCAHLASLEGHQSTALQQSFVFSSKNCKPQSLKKIQQRTRKKQFQQEKALATNLPTKSAQSQEMNLDIYPSSIDAQEFEKLAQRDSEIMTTKSKKLDVKQKQWIAVGATVLVLTLGAVFMNQQSAKSGSYEPVQSTEF